MSGFFSRNVGPLDRMLRVAFGLLFLSLVSIGPHTVWGYIGIVPLLTGFFGVCPLYALLGINTCGVRKSAS